MADKRIIDLPTISSVSNTDNTLIANQNNTYKVAYETLKAEIQSGMISINQGIVNAGKILYVGSDGNIALKKDGGSGSTNILSGTSEPVAEQGSDGNIYLKTAEYDPAYVVNTTSQVMSRHSTAFKKNTADFALAMEVQPKNSNYKGPVVISPTQGGAAHSANTTEYQVSINGETWYLAGGQYWDTNIDSPTIPVNYSADIDSPSASNAQAWAELIFNSAQHVVGDVIVAAYLKVSGAWQDLIGSDISDVSGGGEDAQGFELYAATFGGGDTQNFPQGAFDNKYFVCCFHDNMSNQYTLNGIGGNYSATEPGKNSGYIRATTLAVTNQQATQFEAFLAHKGSVFTSYHNDSGSYISVAGGWVGYPTGGTIYESVATGTTNAITMNSAHSRLLIFFAASNTGLSSVSTIDVNGVTHSVVNMGTRYDSVYSLYTAIEINNNSDTTITVTMPASCYSYLSIIGI